MQIKYLILKKQSNTLIYNYFMLKKVQNINRFTESLDKTFPLISILKSSSTVLVVILSIITSDFQEVN